MDLENVNCAKWGDIDMVNLVEACGELARGFKKLRAVCAGLTEPTLLHPSDMSVDSGDTSDEPKPSGPVDLDDVSKFYLKKYKLVEKQVLNTSFDPNKSLAARWDRSFVQSVLLKGLLTDRLRGDKYKNYWIADPTARRGWRAISEHQLDGIHHMVDGVFFLVKAPVFQGPDICREDPDIPPISSENWHMKDGFLRTEVALKDIVEFARQEHRRLPSLR